jgi:hypothetical protein
MQGGFFKNTMDNKKKGNQKQIKIKTTTLATSSSTKHPTTDEISKKTIKDALPMHRSAHFHTQISVTDTNLLISCIQAHRLTSTSS